MSDDLHDWLTLCSVPGLGPAVCSALLQRFGAPGEILRAPGHRLRRTPGIGPETARAIASKRDETWAAEQIDRAGRAGVRILTLADPEYPSLLRQIYAPPPVLFALGRLEMCVGPAVAVVGSRSFTAYGRTTAARLAGELAARGITVVSGLATGIDAHAHGGALQNHGRTVAVLGSGLDNPYPAENLDLFHRICREGAVLSEFPMGTTPEAHNFPRRNRIISGLSLGVVVIEAGDRSGALITARHALEQGREVFAIPGPVHSGRSFGTNRLIRQGAILVQTADDILQELPPSLLGPEPGPADHPDAARPSPVAGLSGEERTVLACLPDDAPLHIDRIAAEAGISPSRLLPVLLALELADCVEQRSGKYYVRKSF